jgi:hypothetical protein
LLVEGHWLGAPVLHRFEKSYRRVRFGTEKSVGFPALNVIFDSAGRRDFCALCGGGGGIPRIQVELSKC